MSRAKRPVWLDFRPVPQVAVVESTPGDDAGVFAIVRWKTGGVGRKEIGGRSERSAPRLWATLGRIRRSSPLEAAVLSLSGA